MLYQEFEVPVAASLIKALLPYHYSNVKIWQTGIENYVWIEITSQLLIT